jgi:hypothetical protein
LKGALIMTTFPLTDCCELLAVDPKTLRQWLKHATMPLHAHPTDGRRKCLTLLQVQHLAGVHGRILQLPETLESSPPPAPTDMGSAAVIVPTASTLPTPLQEEAHLTTKLSHLETQVALLQEQLARLTSVLLVLPQPRPDHPLVALSPLGEQPLSAQEPCKTPVASGPCPHPAESRRLPLLPLIEYGAHGTYVVICPQEGELHLLPDSPEWFAWLASLASFRFVGKRGRFTACRVYDKGGATRSWQAHRVIHQRHYKPYLGVTERLTIDCLEQAAATLQSYLEPR